VRRIQPDELAAAEVLAIRRMRLTRFLAREQLPATRRDFPPVTDRRCPGAVEQRLWRIASRTTWRPAHGDVGVVSLLDG
jgi:hypothetical protein